VAFENIAVLFEALGVVVEASPVIVVDVFVIDTSLVADVVVLVEVALVVVLVDKRTVPHHH